jgi:hypothetical protein
MLSEHIEIEFARRSKSYSNRQTDHERNIGERGVEFRERNRDGSVSRSSMSNTEHQFADLNRHLVEVPDSFAIARWPRDADVPTIARCILATLKYEPHAADTTALRHALEGVIEHERHNRETVSDCGQTSTLRDGP